MKRDMMTFEQFVKSSKQWVKLDSVQRDWVKDISSGTRRMSFVGRRHGWTTLHNLHKQYNARVVDRPKTILRKAQHGA